MLADMQDVFWTNLFLGCAVLLFLLQCKGVTFDICTCIDTAYCPRFIVQCPKWSRTMQSWSPFGTLWWYDWKASYLVHCWFGRSLGSASPTKGPISERSFQKGGLTRSAAPLDVDMKSGRACYWTSRDLDECVEAYRKAKDLLGKEQVRLSL